MGEKSFSLKKMNSKVDQMLCSRVVFLLEFRALFILLKRSSGYGSKSSEIEVIKCCRFAPMATQLTGQSTATVDCAVDW